MKAYVAVGFAVVLCLVIAAVIWGRTERSNSDEVNSSILGQEQDSISYLEVRSNRHERDFSNAQPAIVYGVSAKDPGGFELVADYVAHNPDWLPGGKEDFFSNTKEKKETLIVNETTEAYICGDGSDENATTPDIRTKPEELMSKISRYLKEQRDYARRGFAGYFEDSGYSLYLVASSSQVLAVFEQCLP